MTDLIAQLVGALEICHRALQSQWSPYMRAGDKEAAAMRAAAAALSEAKAGGWVAVPVEPTPQMTWAATVTADREWCYHVGRDDAKKLWAAMLAVRPLPAPPAQKEPT